MNQESTYNQTYPKLFALAYRMTGSVNDAEDVIQEAWRRLLDQPAGKVDSPPKWLYRTVSNLAIDTLRSAKRTATGYQGPWLPEPVASETYFRGPEAEAIIREDLSIALLLMLENLTPIQRAVWVLRTTLELAFAEIGEIVDRTEQTCRQIFHRAQSRLKGTNDHELSVAPPSMVEQFLALVQSGDANAVADLLMEDSVWIGDGGGIKPATARPVVGVDKVSRGLTSLVQKYQSSWRFERSNINGNLGLLIYQGDHLDSVWILLGTEDTVSHLLSIRNPHKLLGIGPTHVSGDFRIPSA